MRRKLTKKQFNESFEKAPTATKRAVIYLLTGDLRKTIRRLQKELEQLERLDDELEEKL